RQNVGRIALIDADFREIAGDVVAQDARDVQEQQIEPRRIAGVGSSGAMRKGREEFPEMWKPIEIEMGIRAIGQTELRVARVEPAPDAVDQRARAFAREESLESRARALDLMARTELIRGPCLIPIHRRAPIASTIPC